MASKGNATSPRQSTKSATDTVVWRRALLLLFIVGLFVGSLCLIPLLWPAFGPGSGSHWWRLPIPSQDKEAQVFVNFLASGSWIQAAISAVALVVTFLALEQIKEMKEQNQREKNRSASELYRTLINDRMMSIKRFIRHPRVQEALHSFERKSSEISPDSDASRKADYQVLLEDTRRSIGRIARRVSLPLLGRDACLDDIEALINEYNYLSKLLLEKKLTQDFNTALGQENFSNIFFLLEPFIKARQRLSRNYAVHFQQHVERTLAAEVDTAGRKAKG